MAIVLLVRHGRTTANASGILAGWLPGVVLDEVGVAAASSVGARITAAGMPVARLVSSPLERCRQTAALLADEINRGKEQPADAGPTDRGITGPLTVDIDPDLGECRYGAWSGRPLAELAAEPLWRTVQDYPSAAIFPDGELPGESIAAMATRAVAAMRRLDAEVEAGHGPEAVWIAVSHGDVIKAILADAAGTHLDLFQRFVVDPASICAIRYTSGRPFLLRVNDVGGSLEAFRARPLAPNPADTEGRHDSSGADGAADPQRSSPRPGDAAVGGGAG